MVARIGPSQAAALPRRLGHAVLASLALAALSVASAPAGARIVEADVRSVRPFAGGAPFGDAGAYERVTGVARGELDPADARNAGIVDLARAPRNARGRVAYEIEFDLLRPVGGGNRKILFEVTNRGRKLLTTYLLNGLPAKANDPTEREDVGNALYLREGWTLAWSGWDPDAPRAGGGLRISVPIATDGGKPIVETIRDEFQSGTRGPVVRAFKLSYEAASTERSQSRLTVRRREADARVEVPADEWRFTDARTIEILTRGNAGSGPAVGSIYELHYPARDPWVLGIGFAANRDLVSWLRSGRPDDRGTPNPAGSGIRHALAVGISQSGRYLRDHVAQGFNQDEDARRVFDGVLAHISGVGRVFLNARWGQPGRTNTQHEDHLFPENVFPFSAATLDDPVGGGRGALLRGDGFDPLLIATNTATEYWQKGASLLHTDPLGTRDVALPPTVRAYLIASTQHAGRAGLSTARGGCLNDRNPHDPTPAVRALIAALDAWVERGVAPPPSRVPTLREGTLVAPDNAGFPAIPGLGVVRQANALARFGDWVNPEPDTGRGYVPLVSKVDADGNELAGIRLPDIAVPLATYTGWNLYKAPFPDGELCDRDGSHAAFAATKAERERSGDPRLSIAERYADAATYMGRVQAEVDALLRDRLLLREDADAYLRRAREQATKLFGPR
jgi:hypothetical protein